jgi:hypothetical protein
LSIFYGLPQKGNFMGSELVKEVKSEGRCGELLVEGCKFVEKSSPGRGENDGIKPLWA